MLFKDELPPPRYALDGDIDDSELPFTTEYGFISHASDLTKHDLVLLAPRCVSILTPETGLNTEEFGHVEVESRTRFKAEQTAPEFYEVDPDESDFQSSKRWKISFHQLNGTTNPTVVAALPAMSESEAAYTGKQLISHLRPARVVLVTPGQSFMESPVTYLETSGHQRPPFPGVLQSIPPAQPPVIVQGVGAACVSRAQQLGLPALALVLSGDGPANYEIVSPGSKDIAAAALDSVLGRPEKIRLGVERGISELYV